MCSGAVLYVNKYVRISYLIRACIIFANELKNLSKIDNNTPMKKTAMKLATGRLTAAITICLIMAVNMLTSCNDENKANVGNPAVVNVDPAALYQELGIKEEMEWQLTSGNHVVIDTVLFYNESGQLISKFGIESTSLSKQAIDVKGLPDGTYTVVLWQAARNTIHSNNWIMKNEQNLSTATLEDLDAPMSFALAAGYASAKATVKKGAVNTTLTPKAIGSVVEVIVDSLESLGLAQISLWGTNFGYTTGIYLNPELSIDDRWSVDPDSIPSSRVGKLLEQNNSGKFFTLYHDTVYFELCAYDDEDEQFITFVYQPLAVGSHSVFYHNLARRGWQPPFLGTEEAFTTWKTDRDANIPVNDPLLKWGCNYDEVKKHKKEKWWNDGNFELEYWEDPFQCWHRWYYVSEGGLTEQYLFETEDGKNLRYAECYCWDKSAPAELCDNLLRHQGFQSTGAILKHEDDTFEQFISADGTTEAFRSFDSDGHWFIIYQPTGQYPFQDYTLTTE